MRSQEEFAVLLGHEFGHALFKREYDYDYLKTGLTETNDEYLLRRETESDIVGALPLVKGDCYLADVLERLVNSRMISHFLEGRFKPLNQSRITRLRAACAQNY